MFAHPSETITIHYHFEETLSEADFRQNYWLMQNYYLTLL